MKQLFGLILVAVALVGVITLVDSSNKTVGADSDEWMVVCVRGQTVYKLVDGYKALAVNALNDNGTPIPCGNKRGNDNVTNYEY